MKEILFNENWRFREKGFEHEEKVTLPHGVSVEPIDVYLNKQGLFEYKNTFKIPKTLSVSKGFSLF